MTDIPIILPLPSYSEAQDAAYVRTIESIKKLVDVTPTIIAVGDAASNNHLKTLLFLSTFASFKIWFDKLLPIP